MRNILFLDFPKHLRLFNLLSIKAKGRYWHFFFFFQLLPLKSFSLGVGLKIPRKFLQDTVSHPCPRNHIQNRLRVYFSPIVGSLAYVSAPGVDWLPALGKVLSHLCMYVCMCFYSLIFTQVLNNYFVIILRC